MNAGQRTVSGMRGVDRLAHDGCHMCVARVCTSTTAPSLGCTYVPVRFTSVLTASCSCGCKVTQQHQRVAIFHPSFRKKRSKLEKSRGCTAMLQTTTYLFTPALSHAASTKPSSNKGIGRSFRPFTSFIAFFGSEIGCVTCDGISKGYPFDVSPPGARSSSVDGWGLGFTFIRLL